MAIDSIQELKNHIQQYKVAENIEKRTARKRFFTTCGAWYDQKKGKKCFMLDDVFFCQAEKILKQQVSFNHPFSLQRVSPLAQRYVRGFEGIVEAFLQGEEEADLPYKIECFVRTHIAFVNSYTAEMKHTSNSPSIAARINNPRTFEIFYTAALDFLIRNPSYLQIVENKLNNLDSEVFEFLDCTALLMLITKKTSSEEIPEYFLLVKQDIYELQEIYKKLPEENQEQLDLAISGSLIENIQSPPVTAEGKHLFKKILELLHSVRAKNCNSFTAMDQTVIRTLQKDLAVAVALRSSSTIKELPFDSSLKDLIGILAQLSSDEYTKILQAIPDFTPQEQLLLVPDMENQPKLYRAKSIINLARILSN